MNNKLSHHIDKLRIDNIFCSNEAIETIDGQTMSYINLGIPDYINNSIDYKKYIIAHKSSGETSVKVVFETTPIDSDFVIGLFNPILYDIITKNELKVILNEHLDRIVNDILEK